MPARLDKLAGCHPQQWKHALKRVPPEAFGDAYVHCSGCFLPIDTRKNGLYTMITTNLAMESKTVAYGIISHEHHKAQRFILGSIKAEIERIVKQKVANGETHVYHKLNMLLAITLFKIVFLCCASQTTATHMNKHFRKVHVLQSILVIYARSSICFLWFCSLVQISILLLVLMLDDCCYLPRIMLFAASHWMQRYANITVDTSVLSNSSRVTFQWAKALYGGRCCPNK